MSVDVEVVEDPARACAELMLDAVRAEGHIVLAGGSTPRAAYEHLVTAIRDTGPARPDPAAATWWIGDERCVAPDDERSNYRMISESLLEPLGGAVAVRRMRGELGPEEGAADYERALADAGSPEFDLLLAGIGPDGHTLSLFPGKPAVAERSRPVVGVPEAGLEPFVARISFTLAAVARARRVVVLAAGASKAEALARAFGPGSRPDPAVPSSLLPEAARAVTLLLDADAAAGLGGREGR